MPGKVKQFRCPCCGQHAPRSRLDGAPFTFEMFEKSLGGKRKLTEQERKLRRGKGSTIGSAPGLLDYQPVRILKSDRDALAKRIQELVE